MVTEGIQTEAGDESISIDQKLKEIDYNAKMSLSSERVLPFKTLE
jgi:hypothetical protein